MTVTDRLYTLRHLDLFRGLGNAELCLLAEVSRPKVYGPGTVICESGEIVNRLVIALSGHAATASGAEAPKAFDLASVLYGKPVAERIAVGPNGSFECLVLSKGHFFTLINECPGILLNVLRPRGEESRMEAC